MRPRFSRRARSRRMDGAEEPATASSSSMVAVPVRRRYFKSCSARGVRASDMVLHGVRAKCTGNTAGCSIKFTPFAQNLLVGMIDYARYDHGTVSDMYLAYLCETRQSESFSRIKVMIRENSECVCKSRILQGALTIAALTILIGHLIGQLGNAQQAPKLSVMPLPKSAETGQGEY